MTFDYFTGFINLNLIEETEALDVMSEVTRDNYDRGEKPWMLYQRLHVTIMTEERSKPNVMKRIATIG
jgi:hypothetical protein